MNLGRSLFGDICRRLHLKLDPDDDRWTIRLGRFGLAAQAAVIALGGFLAIRAAEAYDPEKAGGIADALQSLRDWGPSGWILLVVALGLVAYGVFEFFEARYRFIPAA